MGDVQEYFIDHDVRNFSPHRSPDTTSQRRRESDLAARLYPRERFTFRRGLPRTRMKIDDFVPTCRFLQLRHGAEYAVLGRVGDASGGADADK